MSLAFFLLSSLDLLNATDRISLEDRRAWIDWIYAQQSPNGGFSGGTSLRISDDRYNPSHLAMTYTALSCLAILGDDLSRLEKENLRSFIRACQNEDGSFSPYPGSTESDIRFVYCAFAISQRMRAADFFSASKAVEYILACRNYDGAFGQSPGCESQGGTTYCALASLHFADRLSTLSLPGVTIRWLAQRLVHVNDKDIRDELHDAAHSTNQRNHALLRLQDGTSGGFQGRPEKDPDVCYSFWVGASLILLHSHGSRAPAGIDAISEESLLCTKRYAYFLLASQDLRGGISKYFEEHPDVYHTYLGLASLSATGYPGLQAIDIPANLSVVALAKFSRV